MPNNETWEKQMDRITWEETIPQEVYVQLKDFIRDQLTLARREERASILKELKDDAVVLTPADLGDQLDMGGDHGPFVYLEDIESLLSPTLITRNEEMQ